MSVNFERLRFKSKYIEHQTARAVLIVVPFGDGFGWRTWFPKALAEVHKNNTIIKVPENFEFSIFRTNQEGGKFVRSEEYKLSGSEFCRLFNLSGCTLPVDHIPEDLPSAKSDVDDDLWDD